MRGQHWNLVFLQDIFNPAGFMNSFRNRKVCIRFSGGLKKKKSFINKMSVSDIDIVNSHSMYTDYDPPPESLHHKSTGKDTKWPQSRQWRKYTVETSTSDTNQHSPIWLEAHTSHWDPMNLKRLPKCLTHESYQSALGWSNLEMCCKYFLSKLMTAP